MQRKPLAKRGRKVSDDKKRNTNKSGSINAFAQNEMLKTKRPLKVVGSLGRCLASLSLARRVASGFAI